MSTKQIEALKLAQAFIREVDYPPYDDKPVLAAIDEALADSALERMAENERELGLDYMETATDVGGRMKIDASAPLVLTPHPAFQQAEQKQPYAQTAAYIKSTTNGRMHVDPVTGDVSIGKKQPAHRCTYPNCPYPCPDLPECRDAEQPASKPLTDEQWQMIADTLGCFITRSQKEIIEATLGIKEQA